MVRFETEYSLSLGLGLFCSLVVHLAALVTAGAFYAREELEISALAPRDPIVLNLQPPAPDPSPPPRQLIDNVRPSDEAPDATDLISDVNSKAADEVLSEGENPGPKPVEENAFDSMASPPALPRPPQEPIPPAPPQPEARPARAPAPPTGRSSEQPRKPKPAPAPQIDPLADEIAAQTEEQPPEETPGIERMQIARATAQPEPEPSLPQTSKGRLHDEVIEKGFVNFEAMQDDIAPYMKEVRRQVEIKWIELLVTGYTGAIKTEAVIDCKISPAGELISADIVKARDRIFAGLCVEALRRAAPFKPFPFKVPEMYREKNLEIRWTFNFL